MKKQVSFQSLKPYLLLPGLFVLTGSLSVLAKVSSPDTIRVEIEMTSQQRQDLLRPVSTEVPQAQLTVYHDGQLKGSKPVSLKSRGQTSLKEFPRKNLSVESLATDESGNQKLEIGSITGKDLILSASPQDQLAIKNMIVYRLMEAVGISVLPTKYAEVVVNQESQGLHMVTENPTDYLMKEKDADIVFRRRYNDVIEFKKAKKSLTQDEIHQYQGALSALHRQTTKLEGSELVQALEKSLNLENYMKWLAINYLVKNGDFMDEVFFYGKKQADGSLYFDIFPWDLDDTFADSMHASKFPGPNTAAEEKSRSQMLFGFESRIDETVSADSVLLKKYHQVVESVVHSLSDSKIDAVITEVQNQLAPYLSDQDVLKNGELDEVAKAHVPEEVFSSLQAKGSFLKQRLNEMKQESEMIKNESGSRHIPMNPLSRGIRHFQQKLMFKFSGK